MLPAPLLAEIAFSDDHALPELPGSVISTLCGAADLLNA
jgi:hypothetical protein